MTTTELGIFNISLSIFMVFITLVGSSIPLTISKITAHNKVQNKNHLTNYYVGISTIYTSVLAIIISIVIFISEPLIVSFIGYKLGYDILKYLIPSILFTAIYSQLKGYLWGMENYFDVSIVEFIEQIIKIVLCFAFTIMNTFSNPIIAVSMALNISCGLSTFIGIYLYFKNGGNIKFARGYLKPIIHSTLPLTAIRVFSSLLMPIISIIIPLRLVSSTMPKSEILSNLGVLMGMSMPLLSIPSTIIGALSMILIPRLSKAIKNTQNRQIDYYIRFTIICIFIFIPIFYVLGIDICNLVFNNSLAGVFLKNLCWVILPMGLSQITTAILNALSQEHKAFVYFIISNVIMILFILIFSPLFDVSVMLIGMGLGCTITTILNILRIRKITGYRFNAGFSILIHILIASMSIMLSTLILNILRTRIHSIIYIGVVGIVAFISYIALLFAFGQINIDTIKKFTTQKSLKTSS